MPHTRIACLMPVIQCPCIYSFFVTSGFFKAVFNFEVTQLMTKNVASLLLRSFNSSVMKCFNLAACHREHNHSSLLDEDYISVSASAKYIFDLATVTVLESFVTL